MRSRVSIPSGTILALASAPLTKIHDGTLLTRPVPVHGEATLPEDVDDHPTIPTSDSASKTSLIRARAAPHCAAVILTGWGDGAGGAGTGLPVMRDSSSWTSSIMAFSTT